ncbi:MAG: glutamate 5-kinase [Kiritimatiellae bacterium]|nr:glutamate 5-kinase [Kiritimatiellia bacterium]MDW8457975.1 glutamate 5-kinase [Verrucomicrobiota bacterium]
MHDAKEARTRLAHARRIVVKIGSRVLVQRTGRPDVRRMRELVRQIAGLHKAGRDVVVVSSGAIGSGIEALGWRKRPTSLKLLQMAAAVGQSRLMARYDELFGAHDIRIGQLLLTHEDLRHRTRHLNAHETMQTLLEHRVVPIVNENDVVAVDEIKFGDNDLLAALTALLVQADALVLLTTVDGFRAPVTAGRTRRVPVLAGVSEKELSMALGKGSQLSTGGMASKLQSAGMVAENGIPVVIANGRSDGVLERLIRGEDVGTIILPSSDPNPLSRRERWIALFHRPKGSLVVDDGAREAVETRGKSLLPVGIRAVEGNFDAGAVVNLKAGDGSIFGRGLSNFSSTEIRLMKGKRSDELEAVLGASESPVVVHRDNMVFRKKEAPATVGAGN